MGKAKLEEGTDFQTFMCIFLWNIYEWHERAKLVEQAITELKVEQWMMMRGS